MQAIALFAGLQQRGRRAFRVFDVYGPGDRSCVAVQALGERHVYLDHPRFGLTPTHGPVARAVREATGWLMQSAALQQEIRRLLARAGVR